MVRKANILGLAILLLFVMMQSVEAEWSGPFPDTGQTKCYNNTEEISCPAPGELFYGQDAHYPGPGRSYTKLGLNGVELPDSAMQADGWIMTRDNLTGQVWQIKTESEGLRNKDNTYSWHDPDFETNGGDAGTQDGGDCTGSVCDTHSYIQTLNDQNFGGFTDWRMPTIKELSLLINSGRHDPAIDIEWFPAVYPSRHWSSTTNAGQSDAAWYVYFSMGMPDSNIKELGYGLLAVRSGRPVSFEDLIIHGDGTVTDPTTGLMWQQETAPDTFAWEDALVYAEALELGGFTNWRLPDRNELQSLADYSLREPAIVSSLAPWTFPGYYWSSTTRDGYEDRAWCVSFMSGLVASYSKANSYRVRSVRSIQTLDPVLSFVPSSHDFGDTTVGASSATRTFTITNTGGGSLVLGAMGLSGTHASAFGIENDACSGQSLSASASCTVDVLFSSDSEGVKIAALTMPSNGGTGSVVLSGTATASGGGGPTEVSGDQYDGSGGPWTLSGSPYILVGTVNVPQGQTLTIEPGVTVLFDGNHGIDVLGALVADGTAEARIAFSSNKSTPARGDWKSIYFEPGGGTSVMDYCTVEYGGSDTGWGWANICVDGISTVTITNTVSRYSEDAGLYVKGNASPVVSHCEFAHNGYDAMAVQINSYPELSYLSAHANNRWNGIMVEGGHITRSGTWYAARIPYVIDDSGASSGNRDIVSGVTLTIMPGTVIKMKDNGTVSFNVAGTLISQGTTTDPIVFTSVADDEYLGDTNGDGDSTTGEPEDWESVELAAESTGSIVTNTIFRFGGEDDYTVGIFTDHIRFEDNTISHSGADGIKIENASPELTHIKVHDSRYDGIWLVNSSALISGCESSNNGTSGIGMTSGSTPEIRSCILTGNGDAGVSAQNGSAPLITGSAVYGNANYGVINETASLTVNAQDNWWGDASGPLDDSNDEDGYYNPDGTGSKVSDHVDYRSWLTAAPGVETPVLSVSPASHDFGNTEVGASAPARNFTITNTGGGSLVLGTISLSGTHASAFGIENDACSSQSLSASASCTVDVLFSPDSEGVKTATLVIPWGNTDVLKDLTGTGITGGGALAGDINGDSLVDLADLIIGLKISIGMEQAEIHLTADVDGDGKIGIPEALHILRTLAEKGSTGDWSLIASYTVNAGGTILEAGPLLVDVPENAFSEQTTLNIYQGHLDTGLDDDLFQGVGLPYRFEFGSPPQKPVTVTFAIDQTGFEGDPANLYVSSIENVWVPSANAVMTHRIPLETNIDSSVGTARAVVDFSTAFDEPDQFTIQSYARSSEADNGGFGFTVHLTLFSGFHAESDNGLFRLWYNPSVTSNAYLQKIVTDLTASKTLLESYGFSFARRTGWPFDVYVKDLTASVLGQFEPSAWGVNYSCLNIHKDESVSDRDLKAICGHEWFHFLQSLYDPRSAYAVAVAQGPYYWLSEASSVWFMAKIVGDPDYVPDLFIADSGFINDPLETNTESHGYGASGFMTYLTDKYGNTIMREIWEKVSRQIIGSRGSTGAVAGAVANYGVLEDDWLDFAEKFITGTLPLHANWPRPPLSGGIWKIMPEETARQYDLTLKEMQAWHNMVKLVWGEEVPENAALKIRHPAGAPYEMKVRVFTQANTSAPWVHHADLAAGGETTVTGYDANPQKLVKVMVMNASASSYPGYFDSSSSTSVALEFFASQAFDFTCAELSVNYRAQHYTGSVPVDVYNDIWITSFLLPDTLDGSFSDSTWSSSWDHEHEAFGDGDYESWRTWGSKTFTLDATGAMVTSFNATEYTEHHQYLYKETIVITGQNIPLTEFIDNTMTFSVNGTEACNYFDVQKETVYSDGRRDGDIKTGCDGPESHITIKFYNRQQDGE